MKPKINSKPVASHYQSTDERIIEFSHDNKGGLLSIRPLENGDLFVQLYRLDNGIVVSVGYDEVNPIAEAMPSGREFYIAEPKEETIKTNPHDELLAALKGIIHHNAGTKSKYQLPASLMAQVCRAIINAESK